MLNRCYIQGVVEAGCDEAGRGPLAGDVFAAAVIFGNERLNDGMSEMLNDSKQLTDVQRYKMREWIETNSLAWAVARATVEEIDRINILNAAILAMHRALDQIKIPIEHIIVDGNRFKPYISQQTSTAVPYVTIVKGDAKYMSIAAASILAKTYRDDYMLELHKRYPMYGWNDNKGYPTVYHYDAIRKYGITPYHRKTFKLKK